MTNLKSQRYLAAKILKIGRNRVWIDPERIYEVEAAITREEIQKLIHERVIKRLPTEGVSRARSRILHEKKKRGRGHGLGSRTGSSHARISKKKAWMNKIRALRKRLSELKTQRSITRHTYRNLYKMANSGRFKSIADMERYLKTHELRRKR